MKVLGMLFLLASIAVEATAQNSTDSQTPPGIGIISFGFGNYTPPSRWDRRDLQGNPVQSPMRAEDKNEPVLKAQKNYIRLDERVPNYRYTILSIINNGTKVIKAIDWDFFLPHVVNKKAVLRYDVRSKIKINPGETKTLKKEMPSEGNGCGLSSVFKPAGTMDIYYLSSKCGISIRVPFAVMQERVAIRRIEYSDGTVWLAR